VAVLLAFAFLSGVVTILSPCILPILPVVLSGGVGGGKARPFGVVAGFAASFTFFTLALTAIVQALGVPADALRIVAVVLIAAFGLVMAVPVLRGLFERLTVRVAGLASRRRTGGAPRSGFWAGLAVGVGLGLVWTPCVGPIMASVITLALTQRVDGGAVAITLAYALGTSVPMLVVMVGGRALLARVPGLQRSSGRVQQVFGVLMIGVAVIIAFGLDRRLQAALLAAFPNYGAGLTRLEDTTPVRQALAARGGRGSVRADTGGGGGGGSAAVFSGAPDDPSLWPAPGTLGDYGLAPEMVTNGRWFNLPPDLAGGSTDGTHLTMASLRGKVVIIDFWTYSCVNCVRTIPFLRRWYEAYRNEGLVIVGVHAPEFEFEKNSGNLARALRDLGVSWPVVQDNDFAEWNAWGNRYWPAKYVVDARGRVRFYHFGEGAYAETERVIRALLAESGAAVGAAVSGPDDRLSARTPETYLGSLRGSPAVGRGAAPPANGQWTLEGAWRVEGEYVVSEGAGVLELGFDARDVFLVIEPEGSGGRIDVAVDGKPGPDTADVRSGRLLPLESRMYHLVRLERAGPHVLRLAVKGRLRLFAFTFG
jgi:cytochrome c biogenesis protein CcdA/thiol-disulfide isomerase/thioredoxin